MASTLITRVTFFGNSATGENTVWMMDGTNLAQNVAIGSRPHLEHRRRDFNADDKTAFSGATVAQVTMGYG